MAAVEGDCGWYIYRGDAYVATFYLPAHLTAEEAKALILKTGDFTEEIEVRKAPNDNPDRTPERLVP